MNPEILLQTLAKVLDNKKAVDLAAIRTTEQTILADYFLIATGTSTTHVKALADELEYEMKHSHGVLPRGIEGRSSGWILLDFGTVLVHIFLKEQREYYNLERLWEDGEAVALELS